MTNRVTNEQYALYFYRRRESLGSKKHYGDSQPIKFRPSLLPPTPTSSSSGAQSSSSHPGPSIPVAHVIPFSSPLSPPSASDPPKSPGGSN